MMKMHYKNIIIAISLAVSSAGFSQEILTKQEALAIALENNFGIQIAKNNVEIAKNNASILNSRFLPSATINSGADYRRNNQKIVFTDPSSGNDAERVGNGVVTKNYSTSDGTEYPVIYFPKKEHNL